MRVALLTALFLAAACGREEPASAPATTLPAWLASNFARAPAAEFLRSEHGTLAWCGQHGDARFRQGSWAVALVARDGWIAAVDGDGVIQQWDAATGRENWRALEAEEEVLGIVAPRDGAWVAAILSGSSIRVHDGATGVPMAAWNANADAGGYLRCAAYLDRIASCAGGDVELRDARTGKLLRRLDLHGASHGSIDVAFVSRGAGILSYGSNGEFMVQDLGPAGRKRRVPVSCEPLDLDPESLLELAASPAGDEIAVALPRDGVRRYSLPDGRELPALGVSESDLSDLRYSGDGKYIACLSPLDEGSECIVWNRGTSRVEARIPAGECFDFRDGGRTLLTIDPASYTLRFWAIPSGSEQAPLGSRSAPTGFLLLPGTGTYLTDTPREFQVRRCDDGRLERSIAVHAGSERGDAEIAWMLATPDGKTVVSASEEGEVVVWTPESGEVLDRRRPYRFRTREVVILADGRTVVSTGQEHAEGVESIRVWEVGRDEPAHREISLAIDESAFLAALPSGRRFVCVRQHQYPSAEDRALLELRDVDKPLDVLRIRLPPGPHMPRAISPDGRWLACLCAFEGGIEMIDMGKEPLRSWHVAGDDFVFDVEWSEDGRLLYVLGRDSLRVLDVATGAVEDAIAIHRGGWDLGVSRGRIYVPRLDSTIAVYERRPRRSR